MAFAESNNVKTSMKGRLIALLALFFVAAQFLAAAHNGAYGDSDHLHDGHPCIVASIVKKSSDMDMAETADFAFDDRAEWIEPTAQPHQADSETVRSRSIRAPPAHA
ncbi:hypothetical protein ACFO5Q_06360 [Kordiimonas lipolytica]|uniref:Uncharacterized protein n=2 Tax=Kordiimonas lipolytica TaxID=1662421 RepID=A0ABV8U9X2_9PROT